MKAKSNKTFWMIIFILSIIIVIASVAVICTVYFSNGSDGEVPLPETTKLEESDSENSTDILAYNPIDFNALKSINTDIYAWITIPDTKIDYPIVQAGKGKDDFYYLNHNVECEYEFAGSIYSEKQNEMDFSDPVTVLYGHNMLNGTMFADLHKFEDENFFTKHPYIYIYMSGRKLTYKIYAAYEYDDRHILNSFDFSDKSIVQDYFDSTLNPTTMNKSIRNNITLTYNDTILTLSTCTNNDATRYLVQGVLFKDERTK